MKRYTFAFFIIFLFFIMLIFPHEVFSGASSGLLLWFQIVLPTLLPFIIISNLLIHTNSIHYISYILAPVLKKIFAVSANGSFAVLVGFLCGYPMGAKVTADLVSTNRITGNEGKYLLSFTNNTSPMFIISYIILQNLKKESLILPTIIILFSSPILCSFIFRQYYRPCPKAAVVPDAQRTQTTNFDFQIIDTCIMNAFETITKVGGYIILFSVILSLVQVIPLKSGLLLSFLEISNGVPLILKNASSFSQAYILIMALASFGGVCSVAQTKSMIQECGLSIFPYIIEKLITALVTSLLAFLYLNFSLHL